ncbi:Variant SH3 domain containing protein [Aphelenchoides avenae]|nr:Variant SH3 domain containing protein [Aphelenchus avenae]
MAQVRAAYDFDAQPGSGELSIKEGEVLTIIRQGIEGGWMEGQNAKGKIGLFPESYVVVVSNLPPATAPPPLPPMAAPAYAEPPVPAFPPPASAPPPLPGAFDDPWSNPLPPTAPPSYGAQVSSLSTSAPPPVSYPQLHTGGSSANHLDDDFDDEWTEDDEEVQDGRTSVHEENKLSVADASNGRSRPFSRTTTDSRTDLSTTDDENDLKKGDGDKTIVSSTVSDATGSTSVTGMSDSVPPSRNNTVKESTSSHATAAQRAVARSRSAGPDTVSQSGKQATSKMKNINRFSNFVKTGMESFILTATKMTTEPREQHEIAINGNRIEWVQLGPNYTCTVDKPKKESKLKGLKSFIAYSVTSSMSGIQVSRRYKHFDWLFEQLANKYILIPIPPLPEKQVAGRYEEDLIEHRKSVLQLFCNKICRHPVLSQSAVWLHFMQCSDEKGWKTGKRQAEKDEYVGGNFFHCVATPSQPLDPLKIERQIEGFSRFMRSLDESSKGLYDRMAESQKRMIGPYKSNWQKVSAAFDSLGQSFELEQSGGSEGVRAAIKSGAQVLQQIGAQHEEHGKRDVDQLMDYLYLYKGILANVPDIVNVHKSALAKLRDNERLQSEGKVSPQDAEAIRHRVDVTSYAMLAEMSHLTKECNNDFRQMLGNFFAQQSAFYMNIGQQLAQLSEQFKNAN